MNSKTPKTTAPARERRQRPTETEVKSFLRSHPDFLIKHPDLVEVLSPPRQANGKNVLDLQQFMVRRLQAEVQRLTSYQSQLIAASRTNMSTQAQVHDAALLLLEAGNFEHLIHIVTTDLAAALDMDAVTLCVEATEDCSPRRVKTAGVYVLQAGTINALVGAGRDIALLQDVPGEDAIFGPAARLIRSQALVRLKTSRKAPIGLLALGSREPDKFHPGQGTELLGFLARILERLIRGWLNLPS